MIKEYEKLLEQIEKNKNKRIAFWGASLFLEGFLKENSLKKYNILGIIDINKQRWGEKLENYEIFSPEKIKELDVECIIISIKNFSKERNKELIKNIKQNFPRVYIAKNVLIKTNNEDFLNKYKLLINLNTCNLF